MVSDLILFVKKLLVNFFRFTSKVFALILVISLSLFLPCFLYFILNDLNYTLTFLKNLIETGQSWVLSNLIFSFFLVVNFLFSFFFVNYRKLFSELFTLFISLIEIQLTGKNSNKK